MNALIELFSQNAERLGWTVIHSLWQGAIAAMALGVALRLLRHRSAAARHGVCLVAMLTMLAAAVVTALLIPPQTVPVHLPRVAPETYATMPPSAAEVSESGSTSSNLAPFPDDHGLAHVSGAMQSMEIAKPWRERLTPLLPWIAGAWLLGVLVLSLRHCGGLWRLRALRRRAVTMGGETHRIFVRLCERFCPDRVVRLLESAEMLAPMLTGILKPIVLLPARVVTGLSAAEIEAILAHELAHLVRHDAWSNLAQVVIETLFFYHPAVWWIGRCARRERENAADDLALEVCADRRVYAGALAHLAEMHLNQQAALAATGGSLLARIQRIVRPAPVETPPSGWSLGIPALLIGLVLLAVIAARAQETKTINVAPGESIQAAIDAAPAGAVIRLGEGEWKERIIISKPLTLEGAGWDKTVLKPDRHDAELGRRLEELQAQAKASSNPNDPKWGEEAAKLLESTILVRGTDRMTIRGLKIGGKLFDGRDTGEAGYMDPLVNLERAKVTITDCVLAGYYCGVNVPADCQAEIRDTLIAGMWSEGVHVHTGGHLHLANSDVRNCCYAGVVLGRRSDSTIIEGCRISGAAWHGIRYDHASPTITGNRIFGNDRAGIYIDGTTAGTIRGNLFTGNSGGLWIGRTSAETIEGNTFVSERSLGVSLGEQSPAKIRSNLFANLPTGLTIHHSDGRGGAVPPNEQPEVTANYFWENKVALQVGKESAPVPKGNFMADPSFRGAAKSDFTMDVNSAVRTAKAGAADPLGPASPWPLLAEEKAIIPDGDTRDSRSWKTARAAKAAARNANASESPSAKAYAAAKPLVADAFQIEDKAKRDAAIERIRAALAGMDVSTMRVGLAAFLAVGKVEFDKASFRPALRKLLASAEADVRAQALQALAAIGPDGEDLDRAIAMQDDASAEVRTALPWAIKGLATEGFTGKAGEAIHKLLDRQDGKATQAVWHAMWGTKISPELEKRVVEASRKDDQGSGYSDVFYYALTVHQSKREPTVTRLIELAASQDTTNVAGRVLWGIRQGLADDQKPRVAELALKVLGARSDGYMQREALACLRECGTAANAESLKELLAKPGVAGEFRASIEEARASIESRPAPAGIAPSRPTRLASRGKVYVIGQVRSPGPQVIPIDETLTVGIAILKAGGLGPDANGKKVKLVKGGEAGVSSSILINCDEILVKGNWKKDVEIGPDDIVIVPEKAR